LLSGRSQLIKTSTAHFETFNSNQGICSTPTASDFTMADYDFEHGEKKKAKRPDTWVGNITISAFFSTDQRTIKSSISAARFRRPAALPNMAARMPEARETGMPV
jgi:hypothetical protein